MEIPDIDDLRFEAIACMHRGWARPPLLGAGTRALSAMKTAYLRVIASPRASGDQIALPSRPTGVRALHGEGHEMPERGQSNEQGDRGGIRAGVLSVRGPGDRVGHVGLHAALPGDRHGRRRRRRGLIALVRMGDPVSSRCVTGTRGRGRLRSLVLLALATVCALAAPLAATAQTGGAPASPSVYRRPLGHDPATLDPARISDVYSRSV